MKITFSRTALLASLLLAAWPATAATPVHTHQRQVAPAAATPAAAAPILQVQNAWVRATAPGQKVAAAYMQLQALQSGVKLQALRSPAAPMLQLHSMQMQGDVMRMHEISSLDLPQGQTLRLQPGGMHIMLMDLPLALKAGEHISITLHFADGKTQDVHLPVLAQAPHAAAAEAPHHH